METIELVEASFWNSKLCQVMVNERDPRAVADSELIRYWVEGQPELAGHLFFATSGSTGASRWVALSRSALLVSARAVNTHLKVNSNDRWLLALPTFHVGGIGVLARAYAGSCSVVESVGSWSAAAYHQQVGQEGITLSSLVPAQLVDLVQLGVAAPSSLRVVLLGGGRLDDAIYQQAVDLGWPVVETYGMTETASQVATASVGSRSMMVLPSWQARVGRSDRLMLSGDALFTGYIECSDRHCQLRNPKSEDWFLTDDVVGLKDGEIEVLGRADRCVKILGELVNLDVVQRNFSKHFGLSSEIVVIALPDLRQGMKLVAATDCKDLDLTSVTLSQSGCHPLHRVVSISVIESLPRSPLGKIRYTALAGLLMSGKVINSQKLG